MGYNVLLLGRGCYRVWSADVQGGGGMSFNQTLFLIFAYDIGTVIIDVFIKWLLSGG